MESRPDFRKSVAVVVGINAYDHGVPPLRTAAADARRLAQLLADEHGYAVHLLLDGEATREALTDLLTVDLPATVGADDRVLFYFAGHGVAVEGDDGPSGYLLLHDARRGEHETYLPMPALYDALNALPCRHLLAILDSCFAGAFRWSATRDMVDLPAVIHQERYDRFILDPAWQAIASASHDQKALDQLPASGALTSFADFGTRGDGGVHSPFAAALIEALEGAGDVVPAGGGDGVITATELYLYLEQRLQPATMAANRRQTPRLWPLAKHDKGEFIFLAPGHELNLPPAPELTFENNPWLGLRSYDEGDEELFFGRESVITTLADYVEDHPLTVVLGASGTGKSSVVKAGLVPQLKRDTAQAWRVLPIVRPGPAPMQALERAVAELESEGGIEERVAAWCATHPGDRLVLVVDQFEELVTLVRSADEREAVLGLLARLVEGHPDRLRLVLTLRSDFEPQFDRTALEPHWKQARFVVSPMTQADLRDVIERPASERVMYFKPAALVDDLIDEVIQTPGGLPLLSFALSEMYVHYLERYTRGETDDRALEVEDYAVVGGVVGALRTRAEAEFAALDAAYRESMRRVMLRMVAVEGGTIARRRVAPSELDYPDPAETERVRTVVRQLTAARLLVEGQGEDGEAYVEPAHDALVRAWDRLIGWLHAEEDRAANLRLQQNMAQAAREWEQTEDTKARAGLLWRDAARSALLAPLVAEEEGRLDAESLTVGQRLRRRLRLGSRTSDAAQSTWMNRRELAFARRSIRRRRNIRLGLSALVLMILVAGLFAAALGLVAEDQRRAAVTQRDEAVAQSRRALSNQLATQAVFAFEGGDDATQSFKLAAAALEIDSTNTSARRALLRAIYGDGVFVYRGRPYARPFYRELDGGSQELLLQGLLTDETRPVGSHMSLDGHTEFIGARSWNGAYSGGHEMDENGLMSAFVLRDRQGEEIGSLPGTDLWTCADFSADGRYLVTGSMEGTVALWEMPSFGRPPQRPLVTLGGHADAIDSAMFSADETHVLTTSRDGTAKLWTLTGHPLAELQLPGMGARTRVYSTTNMRWIGAERNRFARAGEDRDVQWGDAVAASYDGTRMAVADGVTLWIFDDAGGEAIEQPLSAPLDAVAFLPDARSLLTVSNDTLALRDSLGNVTAQRAAGRIDGRAYPAGEDGALAVFQRGDQVLTVDLHDGSHRALAGRLPPTDFAVSANGAFAVMTLGRDTVGVLDVAAGDVVAHHVPNYESEGDMLAISPDGTRVYLALRGYRITIWEWATDQTTGADYRYSLVDGGLAPNGLLATLAIDNVVRIWDDDDEIVTIPGASGIEWLASGRALAVELGFAGETQAAVLHVDPTYLASEAWGGAEPLSAAERARWNVPDLTAVEEIMDAPSSLFDALVTGFWWGRRDRRSSPTETESAAVEPRPALDAAWSAWSALDSLVSSATPRFMIMDLLDENGRSLLEGLSGEPIFLVGPHSRGDFDAHATEFSRYNPHFVEWATGTLIPPAHADALADAAQPVYDRLLLHNARTYWLAKTELERRPALVASALADGTAAEDPGRRMYDTFQPWADSLAQVWNARLGSDWAPDERETAWAATFWARRERDGTRKAFAAGLDTLLQRFDAEWARSRRTLSELESVFSSIDAGVLVWSALDTDAECDAEQAGSYLRYGVRRLYCAASLSGAFARVVRNAAPPVFLSGPHSAPRLDLDSETAFGHYNPAFVRWATRTLIPDSTDGVEAELATAIYHRALRDEARAYWIALRALDAHPGDVKRIKAEYLRQPDPGLYLQGSVAELTRGFEERLESDEAAYQLPIAGGFWVRREIDGSKDEFAAGLMKLLAAADPDFLRREPRTSAP